MRITVSALSSGYRHLQTTNIYMFYACDKFDYNAELGEAVRAS